MICSICKKDLPITEFSIDKTRKRGYTYYCKPCKNAYGRNKWYPKNKKSHIKSVKKNTSKYLERNRNILMEYLSANPCVDCGESDILVLEFDHVRGEKISDVCKIASSCCQPEKIVEEIDKCEVRCANCHKRRTAKNINSYRLSWVSK